MQFLIIFGLTGRVVFTTIRKFMPEEKSDQQPPVPDNIARIAGPA
jgi:hypothetical protein